MLNVKGDLPGMVFGLPHEEWNEEEQDFRLALAIQALYAVGRIIFEESCKKLVMDVDDPSKGRDGWISPVPAAFTAASSSSSLASLGSKEDLLSGSDSDEEKKDLLPTQSKEDKEQEERQSKIWQWKEILKATSNSVSVKELQSYFIDPLGENLRFRYHLGQMYRYLLFLENSLLSQERQKTPSPNYDFYRYQCNASREERHILLCGLAYANEQYKNQFQEEEKNNVFFGLSSLLLRDKSFGKAEKSNSSENDSKTDDGSRGNGTTLVVVATPGTIPSNHVSVRVQGVSLKMDSNIVREKADKLKKSKVIHGYSANWVERRRILEQPIDGGKSANGLDPINIDSCTFYFSSNKHQKSHFWLRDSGTHHADTMISSPDIDSIYRSILVLKEMGYQEVDIEQLSAEKNIDVSIGLEAIPTKFSYRDIATALIERLNLGVREGDKKVSHGSVSSGLREYLDIAIGLENDLADSTIALTKTTFNALETFKTGWKQKLGHTLSSLFMNGGMLGYSVVNAVFFGTVFAGLIAFPFLMAITGLVFLGTWFTCKLIYQNIFPQTIANTIARLQDKTFWKSVWTFEGKDGKSIQLGPGGKVALIMGFVCSAVAAYSLGCIALQATMGLFALAGIASNPAGWVVAAFAGISILIVSTVSFMRAISSFIKQEDRWQSIKDYFSRLVSGEDYPNQSKLAKGIRVVITVSVWLLAVVSMFAGALIGIGASEYVTSHALSFSKTVGNWIGFFSSVVIGGIAQIPFTLSTVGKSVSAFCKDFFQFCQYPIKSIRDWWQKVDIKQSLKNFFGSFVSAGKEAWQNIRRSYHQQKLEWKTARGFAESCIVGINRVVGLVLSPFRFVFSYFEHLLHRDAWRATNAFGDAATAIVGSETSLVLGDKQISMDGGVGVNSVIGITQGFSSAAGTNIDSSREKLEEKPNQQAVVTKTLLSSALFFATPFSNLSGTNTPRSPAKVRSTTPGSQLKTPDSNRRSTEKKKHSTYFSSSFLPWEPAKVLPVVPSVSDNYPLSQTETDKKPSIRASIKQ